MSYDPRELTIISKVFKDLPRQQISRKDWKNEGFWHHFYWFFEKIITGIDKYFEVEEIQYVAPIQTKHIPENNTGRITHYKASSKKAVILLPPRGIGYDFSQTLACYLAARDISAYHMELPLRGTRLPPTKNKSICDVDLNLDILETIFDQTVSEIGGLLNIVEEERVGIFGVSLGGIYSSIAYGLDDRLTSGCLALTGGNIRDLIFNSKDRLALAIREYVEREQPEESEIKRVLDHVEPCNFTNPDKADKLLMLTAKSDRHVPPQYGESLLEAWGSPKIVELKGGHGSVIFQAPSILKKVYQHFEKTL